MAIKNSHLLKKDKPTIPQLTYGNIETPIVNERETDARTPNGTVHFFCETKNTTSVAQIKENKTNHFWNSLEKLSFILFQIKSFYLELVILKISPIKQGFIAL